mmetsp:Transcript_108136/g.209332  ORF Transcript_108136/g.209332 Transcript_108136/m.209332 type:complete len:198 (+) Transcript_108136:177-770(+)
MFAIMLLVLVSGFLNSLATARAAVLFDFGWKHRNGLHTWAGPDDRPPANPDPGNNPVEAQVEYNDSDWELVHLPHDGLVGAAPSLKACPLTLTGGGCSGYSFIPWNVLWHRKKFSVPAAWRSCAVWLDFEGSFRNTTVWINGENISSHDCGYTPFRVRLGNVTSIKCGATNVVSVFVDPANGDMGSIDHGSGWWYEG